MRVFDSGSELARQTSSSEDFSELRKYAVIGGKHVTVPEQAKFYFQDYRGGWYWSIRRPRVKDGDWTPNKSPIQILNERGHDRALITDPREGTSQAWRATLTEVVNLDFAPLAMFRRVDFGPAANDA